MIKPLLRALMFKGKWLHAKRLLRLPPVELQPLAFLVGCGRSGTTILGSILESHQGVCYLNEPYHYWAVIEPQTDVTQLHLQGPARYFLDQEQVDNDVAKRAGQVFGHERRQHLDKLIVEKTPHNVCRLGFLNSLFPNSRYVNIIRNGMMVVRSIRVAAEENPYKVFGQSDMNPWWGRNDNRWKCLASDGNQLGYFSDELKFLESSQQRAAYEWVVSVLEAERWKPKLDHRMMHISYQDLTSDPVATLRDLTEFLGLAADSDWLEQQSQRLRPERSEVNFSLELPARLAAEFNRIQDEYGFDGHAEVGFSSSDPE